MPENYQHSLERVVDVAVEVVLTAHRSYGGTLVDEETMDRLQRALIESNQLRKRLNDRLSRADDDAYAEALSEGLQRSE
jgi:hypothetical protein